MQLAREDLAEAYRRMRAIRAFEERVAAESAAGLVPGFVHLYAGQEASAVGICLPLRDSDVIGSTHRGHGHCIAKGCDIDGMMLEIFGRAEGLCGGKGGSMHIADLSKGMLGANAIVGGNPPLVVGAALTAKTLRTGAVAVSFSGDGAANQGTMFESLNLALVWRLPAIFVIENNDYAEGTGAAYHCGAKDSDGAPDFAGRARGMGLPAASVDGRDFFAVHGAMEDAVERARGGDGPSVIVTHCPRYFGHFVGDPQSYRSKAELAAVRAADPLQMFRARVTQAGLLDDETLNAIDAEIATLIEAAASRASVAAFPDPESLQSDVYVSY